MDADVLVIGAGVAGLSLAAHLRRRGVAVHVVEQAERPRTTGCGIMLHPNAMSHLGYLAPELSAAGATIETQVTFDPSGTSTVVNWEKVWDGRLPVAIHRRRLAELMLGHLAAGTVRWQTRPRILRQDVDGVSVALADGEIARYSLVVGADGIGSSTRRITAPGQVPEPVGQTFWRSTAPAAAPVDFREWRVWRNGSRFFGAMPIGGQRMHVFVQVSGESAPAQAGLSPATGGTPGVARHDPARETMINVIRSIGGTAAALAPHVSIDGTVDVRAAYRITVPRWALGRIGLVGDAAHSLSPATTQGAALAIEDAAVLAEEITRRGLGPEALVAYEQRRLPRVAAFARLADLHASLMASLHRPGASAPDGQRLRDASSWFRRLYSPLLEPA